MELLQKIPNSRRASNFAFVSSVLLPNGTPDVHFRTACGRQKLRNIMLNTDIELYGPYSRPILNCAGGGTCGTCIVEIVEVKQLLSLRTDKEKEKLKKKPKNWGLACQATVGDADSSGLLVVQQLPEWKGHSWGYEKVTDEEKMKAMAPCCVVSSCLNVFETTSSTSLVCCTFGIHLNFSNVSLGS